LRRAGRDVRYLLFSDDGHQIVKRENSTALTAAMSEWLNRAFGTAQPPVDQDVARE
jgi:dipeptidyl aminopeptidase/acylaminoacyl peptidase